jgi:hypothetical protein
MRGKGKRETRRERGFQGPHDWVGLCAGERAVRRLRTGPGHLGAQHRDGVGTPPDSAPKCLSRISAGRQGPVGKGTLHLFSPRQGMGGKGEPRQGSAGGDVGTSSANDQAPIFTLLVDGMSLKRGPFRAGEHCAARGTWAPGFPLGGGRREHGNHAAFPAACKRRRQKVRNFRRGTAVAQRERGFLSAEIPEGALQCPTRNVAGRRGSGPGDIRRRG